MNIIQTTQIIVCVLTLFTGVWVFIKPSAAFGFTGLRVDGARGISELRAIFGGLFIGMGIAPLFLGSSAIQMLGYCYLSIAISRVFSIIFDKSYERSNIISVFIEVFFGLILVF